MKIKIYIFIISALLFYIYGYMNTKGFCWKQLRYISDEEKLDKAIDVFLKNYNTSLLLIHASQGGGIADYYERRLPYASKEEFLRDNNDNFHITKQRIAKFTEVYGGESFLVGPKSIEKFFGTCNYSVSVQGTFRYIKNKTREDILEIKGTPITFHHNEVYIFNSCAEPCRRCKYKIKQWCRNEKKWMQK